MKFMKKKKSPSKVARTKAAAESRNASRDRLQSGEGISSPKRLSAATGAEVLANAERKDRAMIGDIEVYVKDKLDEGPSLNMIKCISGLDNPMELPIMSNATIMLAAATVLGQSTLRRIDDAPAYDVGLVTFTARDLDTTLEAPVIQATMLRKRMLPALTAMADDFFATDGGLFYTPWEAPGGGILVRPAGLGIICGVGIRDRAAAAAAKYEYRFPPGSGVSHGVNVEWHGDADREVAVMKAVVKFFRPVQKWPTQASDGTGSAREPKYARQIIAMRCLEAKAVAILGRRIFGKGQGIAMRAEVVEQVRSALKKANADSHPPLQATEVLHKFYDLWKAFGIGYRPVLIK